jgi:hypothetical protein
VQGHETLLNAKVSAQLGHFTAGQAVGIIADAAHALAFDGHGTLQGADSTPKCNMVNN